MVTMMQHPQHGRHPAMGHEVEPLKAQGWIVMPPKIKEQPKKVEVEQPAAPEEPRQKRKYTHKAT
jgi:hypothetical protein